MTTLGRSLKAYFICLGDGWGHKTYKDISLGILVLLMDVVLAINEKNGWEYIEN